MADLFIQWIIARFNGKSWRKNMVKYTTFINRFRSISFAGLCRYLFLKLRGKSILVTGSCSSCGTCCRSISLEGSNGWLRSERDYDDIVLKYPEYERFQLTGKDSQGFLLFSCKWISPLGTCLQYEERLPLCRGFPESSLLFSGGKLPPNCGYRFVEVVPFEQYLKKEMQRK